MEKSKKLAENAKENVAITSAVEAPKPKSAEEAEDVKVANGNSACEETKQKRKGKRRHS